MDLAGSVALVTGASRGIGRAIARELARRGASVAINYARHRIEADALVDEIGRSGGQALGVQGDVSRSDDVRRVFDRVEATWGPVRVLVNNAGIDHEAALEELAEEDWDRVLAVNLKGPFLCLRRAIQTMGPGGSVINVSSIHDHVPRRGSAHYCASKAGLAMLTRTAALELGPRGIRVNAVSPGAILTDMNRELIEHEIGLEAWREWIPVGRVGRAEEVAALTAFLASEASSYVTGAVITADGGYSLNLVRYGP